MIYRYHKIFVSLVMSGLLLSPFQAQTQTGQNPEMLSVKIYYQKQDIPQLVQWVEHGKWNRQQQILETEIDSNTFKLLKNLGIKVEINTKETQRIQQFIADRALLATQKRSQITSKTFGDAGCYRTVEETFTSMDTLQQNYSSFAEVKTIGQNWLGQQANLGQLFDDLITNYGDPTGRLANLKTHLNNGTLGNNHPIKVLVIGNKNKLDNSSPNFVITAGIHAREYTPPELSLRFAEDLLNKYGSDPQATWILDHVRIHLIIQHNPAGRKMAEVRTSPDYGGGWRKNVNLGTDGYCSTDPYSSGVDLNRNFPFTWNQIDRSGINNSSGSICNPTYRGVSIPEPEISSVVGYITGVKAAGANGLYAGGVLPNLRQAPHGDFTTSAPNTYTGLFLDIHSNGQSVFWPWGAPYISTGDYAVASKTGNNQALADIGQRVSYYNGHTPSNQFLYDTNGDTVDHVYGATGAPALGFEIGPSLTGPSSFYEPCSVFNNYTYPYNLKALYYLAKIAYAPYQMAAGPIVKQITLSKSSVNLTADKTITISATVDDTPYMAHDPSGLSRPDPTPVMRNITEATVYVDTPPWKATANTQTLSLQAIGTGFGSQRTQTVQGTLDISQLSVGKHLLYIQGGSRGTGDTTNQKGAPEAIFLEVTSSGSSGGGGGGTGNNSQSSDNGGGGSIDIIDTLLAALVGWFIFKRKK
jgi:carboxypeptidase T